MDLVRLRALRELALRGSVIGAAEVLFLTPSAVSQQISHLEAEVGVPLTERRGRGVRLTGAGESLVRHTERILNVLDEARSELAAMHGKVAGEIRLAAFPSIAAMVLPTTIHSLRSLYPYLSVVVEEVEPTDGLAALRSWRVDVAIVDDQSYALSDGNHGVETVPLVEDDLVLLLSNEHPLAERAEIRISELVDQFWAIYSISSSYGGFIFNICRQAGFEPNVIAKYKSFEMVGSMVASGCAIALVPRLRLITAPKGVVAVPLHPRVKRKISIAYRKGERDHPAVHAVVEQLLLSAGKHSGAARSNTSTSAL